MVISISGYNDTGKTTSIEALSARFQEEGIEFTIVKFDSLYPSRYLTKKPKRKPKFNKGEKIGLRKIEAQKGSWNKPFRLSHLLNMLAASTIARIFVFKHRKKVVLFDRFLLDRYVNFAPNGRLYRIAKRFGVRPTLAFVLLPSLEEHERRILKRLEKRHRVQIESLTDEDRQELAFVHQRYREICSRLDYAVLIDAAPQDVHQSMWNVIAKKFDKKKGS